MSKTPFFTVAASSLAVTTLQLMLGCSAGSNDSGKAQGSISPATSDGSGGEGSGGGRPIFQVAPPTGTNTTAIDPNFGVGVPTGSCNPKLIGVVRDFNSAASPVNPNSDFETFVGTGITAGLVKPVLGADGAPVYQDPQPPGNVQLTSASNFALWYNKKHPAKATIQLDLDNPTASAGIKKSVDQVTGATTYESTSFFPIDGAGTQSEDLPYFDELAPPNQHNFHFTFELNTKFIYKPGQIFTFFGDDDLWVFIDKKLAVDVGGLHAQELGSVALDTLGLVAGKEYELSVFHAERHTDQSNFKATTNITFSNCEPILR
ncbi:MAG: fibro-slime domain-containing protein [Polyangiaceae bacterium]|nr:fibro-slime domain-containing protein [Polyangiaceae bacterium]